MFHRVKSEVQETEQRVQQRQKVDVDYRQDDDRNAVISREARDQQVSESVREESQVRSYSPQIEVKEQQEEVRPMSRPLEDKEVQGKYAAREVQQDQTAPRARSADVSSVASAPPLIAGSAASMLSK